MNPLTILAIDVGTTGVTALLISTDASITARGCQEFEQHPVRVGWNMTRRRSEATPAALGTPGAGRRRDPDRDRITNQRETLVMWDRETLGSPTKAIVWQDRRTAGICAQLHADGYEEMISERTGLRLDPYFTGTKLSWVKANEPHVWAGVESGRTAVGTVDSYPIARLTRGLLHVTDASNASRTLLYNLSTGEWDSELCEIFGVPMDALPEIVPSYGEIGTSDPDVFLGLSIPIAGLRETSRPPSSVRPASYRGPASCTYGTSSFVLVNTGAEPSDPMPAYSRQWRGCTPMVDGSLPWKEPCS